MKKLRLLLRRLGHLGFLRFGLRDRVIRFFHHPDTTLSEKFCVDFYGCKYQGDFKCFIDWSAFYYGAYSKDELTILEQLSLMTPKTCVLDIGANIGHHSLFFSTIFKKVHSFEPLPFLADEIARKIKINKLRNIHIHRVALGERTTMEKFYPPTTNNTGTGSFINNNNHAKPIEIQVFNADEYIKTQSINDIHLIKIDVEGYEVHVIRGLAETLIINRPIVFFEWSKSSELQLDSFFPEKYHFFKFIPAQHKYYFFSDQRPQLCPIDNKLPTELGNFAAIPYEKLDRNKLIW